MKNVKFFVLFLCVFISFFFCITPYSASASVRNKIDEINSIVYSLSDIENLTVDDINNALELIDVAFITDVFLPMVEDNSESFILLGNTVNDALIDRGVDTYAIGTWAGVSSLITVGGASAPGIIGVLTNPVVLVILLVITIIFVFREEIYDFWVDLDLSYFYSKVYQGLSYSKSFVAIIKGFTIEGKEYAGALKDSTIEKMQDLGTRILNGKDVAREEFSNLFSQTELKNIKNSLVDIDSSGIDNDSVYVIKGNNRIDIVGQVDTITYGLKNLGLSSDSDYNALRASDYANNLLSSESFSLNPFYILVNNDGYYFITALRYYYGNYSWVLGSFPDNSSSIPIAKFPTVTYSEEVNSITFDINSTGLVKTSSSKYDFGYITGLRSTGLFSKRVGNTYPIDESTKIYVYNPYISLPTLDDEKVGEVLPPLINNKTGVTDLKDSYNEALLNGTITKGDVVKNQVGVENPTIVKDSTTTGSTEVITPEGDTIWEKVSNFLRSLFIPTLSILSFINLENSLVGQILMFDELDILEFYQVKPYFEFSVFDNRVELPLGDVLENNHFLGLSLIEIMRNLTSVFFVINALVFVKNRFDIQRTQD